MKFAVIGDIHANLPALEAALATIQADDVDAIISTGDIVGYLPYPNEVIDVLRQHKVVVVQGNHDARFDGIAIETPSSPEQLQAGASLQWTFQTLTDKNRDYLSNLPSQLRLNIGRRELLVVHGSHRANNEYVYNDSEQLAQIASDIQADVFISGHTHEAYVSVVGGKTFINPGSVGKPKIASDLASYAVVEISANHVQAEVKRVSYSTDKLREKIIETDGIDSTLEMLFI